MGVNGVSFLSAEFLAQYEGQQPRNKGPLFEVVYYRTYSRWRPDLKRRERWGETIQRVVEYSMSLYQGPADFNRLRAEAEAMYDKLFHLEAYPAGRSYWIAGSPSALLYPESNFNCCMCVIDRLSVFGDLFHLLMLGCGVGFRILDTDVGKLPILSTAFVTSHFPYQPVPKSQRQEETTVLPWSSNVYMINIGDSKGGWIEALRQFLNILAEPKPGHSVITFNYNNIRPAGERLKTFGGRAAGPHGLREMFEDVEKIVKENAGKLTPVAAMDLCNIIAKNVLVGGVRRSSQIALGGETDQEFIDAKVNLFNDPEKKDKKHRIMSNNTVVYKSKPKREVLQDIFKRIKESWEPGFLNHEAASKRRPWFASINPCGEALGADMGNCNLTGIVLPAFIREDDSFDLQRAEEAIRLATRIGLRQTNITWSLPEWDAVHKRDRLLGVSMTGIMDALDRLGVEFDDTKAITIFEHLRWAANDEADIYAFEMRVPRPLLVTILKPEGSISQLPTVSSGIHRSYAPYYIRRIRVSNLDPVCMALQELGVPNEPDVNKGERIVFSFPVKTKAKIAANDESAVRQFERYLTLMKYYVDHNASTTITVGEGEWEDIVDRVHENWDDVVACAFANKDNSQYPQLPYEQITEEKYLELSTTFPDLSHLDEIINRFENEEAEEDELDNADCSAGGHCPIR
jgi:adenosylcobalamin-dependent ribonucleoside-triphosphate reductase